MMENFPVRARTEVRTRWTAQNLYFLFVCPYEQLNLRPNPKTSTETYGLWNWDVAEVFIGADFITRKVGPGIPASRFRHESTVLLAFGTAQ